MHKAPNSWLVLATECIGSQIRDARTALRYSYRDLAKVCGVSAGQIQRIETGSASPSLETLFNICVGLGLPIGDLIDSNILVQNDDIHPDFDDEMDFKNVIEWAVSEGQKLPRIKDKLRGYINISVWLIVQAASASRPEFDMSPLASPSMAFNAAFHRCAVQFRNYSNTERLALLQSLKTNPVQKLKSLGLLSQDILREIVIQKSVTLPGKRIPESLLATMMTATVRP